MRHLLLTPLAALLLVSGLCVARAQSADALAAQRVTLYLCGRADLGGLGPAVPRELVQILALTESYRAAHPAAMRLGDGQVERFVRGEITLAQLEGRSRDELLDHAETGYAAFRADDMDTARAVFEGLVSYDPYVAYFHSALGTVYQRAGRLDEALRQYELALKFHPHDTAALVNRGEVLLGLGRRAEALEHLQRAIACDPERKDPWALRARWLLPEAEAAPAAAGAQATAGPAPASVAEDDPRQAGAAAARDALLPHVEAGVLRPLQQQVLQLAARTPAAYADGFLTADDSYANLQEAGQHLEAALSAARHGQWQAASDAFWRAAISADAASTAWPQLAANLACVYETASAAADGLGGEVQAGLARAEVVLGLSAAPAFRQQAREVARLLSAMQGTGLDRSSPSPGLDPAGVPAYGPAQAHLESTLGSIMWGH